MTTLSSWKHNPLHLIRTRPLVVINVTGGKRSVRGGRRSQREKEREGGAALGVHIDPLSSQTFSIDLDLPDNQLTHSDR